MRCSCQKRRYFASGGPKPEVFHHLTGNVVAQWRFVVAPKGQSEKDAHLTVVREAAFICRYPSRRVIRLAAAATGMADEDLIQAGADVNATNDASMTVLTLLSQRGRPDEIATLLRAGADGRRKDAAGRTALDLSECSKLWTTNCHEERPAWDDGGGCHIFQVQCPARRLFQVKATAD